MSYLKFTFQAFFRVLYPVFQVAMLAALTAQLEKSHREIAGNVNERVLNDFNRLV